MVCCNVEMLMSVMAVGAVGGGYQGRGTQLSGDRVQMLDRKKSGKEGPKDAVT